MEISENLSKDSGGKTKKNDLETVSSLKIARLRL